jgi:atypical dual specificity phosphatase
MPLSISDKGAFLTGEALTKIANATISSSSLRISVADASCSIELLSSSEMHTLSTQTVNLTTIDEASIFPIGIGGDPTRDFYYVSIAWNASQLMRKKFGLPPKPSRIYFNAEHGQDDMDTPLLYTIPQGELSLEALDHIAFSYLQLGRLRQARELAEALCKRAPESENGWTRLGDIALQQKAYKLAMLAFGRVLHLTIKEKVLRYVKRRMLECAEHTEWGHVFQKGEVEQLPENLVSILLVPWTQDLRSQLQDIYGDERSPLRSLDSRIPLTTILPNTSEPFELPSFFRWIVPFHFAVTSTPRNEEDISILASPILGIRHVVTLTEETLLDEKWFVSNRITHTHMPIEHHQCPTIEQVDLIIEMFQDENKLPLLVHCAGGKGRTGTIAACYIAAYGFNVSSSERTQPLMSPSAAIDALESMRPRLSRTPQQDGFVGKWVSTVWKRHSILPERMSEPPPCSLEIRGNIPPESDLLMLCGLQGRPAVITVI